ncbi:HrgA protein [Helicobacter pylori]
MKPQDIEIVQSVLEITGPISPTEVYDKAKELFERGEITNMFDYGGNTPHQSVSSLIYTALNNGEELPFFKVQEKPALIALKGAANEPVLSAEKISAPSVKIAHNKIAHERDLHPFSKKFDTLPVKLVSFELKKEISVNNCRECYFQAISNSSNEGYLVGRHIDTHNPQLMDLLKRLHASFGIGVIDLRTNEDKSAILLNAKYKEKIDYTVASELSAKNEKFSGFLKSVVDYDPNHQHRYKDEFDEVKKKEELYPNPSLSF